MVSESLGRNVSELIGGLEKIETPEVESSGVGRRQHGMSHPDRRDISLRRGARGGTVARTR